MKKTKKKDPFDDLSDLVKEYVKDAPNDRVPYFPESGGKHPPAAFTIEKWHGKSLKYHLTVILKKASDYVRMKAEDRHFATFIGFRNTTGSYSHIAVIKNRYGKTGTFDIVDALKEAAEGNIPWEIFEPTEIVKYRNEISNH